MELAMTAIPVRYNCTAADAPVYPAKPKECVRLARAFERISITRNRPRQATSTSHPSRPVSASCQGASLAILICCLGAVLGLTPFSLQAAEKNPNAACLDCHADKRLNQNKTPVEEKSQFFDQVFI